MSDFFESENSASAVSTIEREMVREEGLHVRRRRLMVVVLIAAAVFIALLGGSLVANATARKPATKAATVAPAKHVATPPAKHKHK